MPSITTREYYTGKAIFITGATGFMGKVLVEKLLRDCPDIKAIYLLVRSKKGQSSKERLETFISSRAFEKLLDQNPKAFYKLHLISGDISEDNLGLSIKDKEELQRECQIVINNAASVRFDLDLRVALNLNTIGTQKVLQLCEKMKKIEVFLHVSTTFCHDELEVMEEKLYPAKHNLDDILNMTKWMDDKELAAVQSELIHPFVNTYGYTKSLTEQVVSQYSQKFPIVIARPSVVTASVKEPMPGWVDNINGPTGVIYAAYRGILHTMYCKDSISSDTIPVDIVISAIILLAYLVGVEKPTEVRVCNISNKDIIKESWNESAKHCIKYMREYPLSYALWYPSCTGKNYKLENTIYEFFTHILPAYFIDLMLFLLGKKTFMINVLSRLNHGVKVLEHYNSRTWNFKNDYFRSLQHKITKEDNEIFQTDISNINLEEFMKNYVKGVREFYCKEDLSTLPQARRLNTWLYCLHVVTKYSVYFLFVYLIYKLTTKIYFLFNLC